MLKNTEFLWFWSMVFEVEVLNLKSQSFKMKNLFALFSAIAIATVLNAQTTAAQEVLVVKETAFDFGTIPQGKPVYHFFEVTNSGKDPMVISNVQTSCGCTTPEWSKEPIAPGATAKVRVGYNAAGEGHFEKYITIMYNQNLSKQVKIQGTVWKAPAGSAPENSSITLLKQKNN
jgi:hypothetical protein